MLNKQDSLSLLQTLLRETLNRSLAWRESVDSNEFRTGRVSLGNGTTYTTQTKKHSYALSTGDPFGREPYDLKAWKGRAMRGSPLAQIGSSILGGSLRHDPEVNQALAALVGAVQQHAETSASILQELLDDF